MQYKFNKTERRVQSWVNSIYAVSFEKASSNKDASNTIANFANLCEQFDKTEARLDPEGVQEA